MWWTLASTLVASSTALFIACVVYPWQKSIDRTNEALKERRAFLQEIVAFCSDTEVLLKRPAWRLAGAFSIRCRAWKLNEHARILHKMRGELKAIAELDETSTDKRKIHVANIAKYSKDMLVLIADELSNFGPTHVGLMMWIKSCAKVTR